MDLPLEISGYILSFCGEYNYQNRLVCKEWFSLMIEKVTFGDFCKRIVEDSCLSLLKLHKKDIEMKEMYCGLAAKRGHLKILQWLRDNGCPWNGWTCA